MHSNSSKSFVPVAAEMLMVLRGGQWPFYLNFVFGNWKCNSNSTQLSVALPYIPRNTIAGNIIPRYNSQTC